MAKIGTLSNHTRAVLRPPLMLKPVSTVLIARLLPAARSSASKRQAPRAAKANPNGRDKSAKPVVQPAAQNGRSLPNVTAAPSLRLPPAQPGKFSPKPDASKTPYTANRLVSQPPAKNGHASTPPTIKNGTERSGHNGSSADIFGDYSPVKSDPGKTAETAQVKPAEQLPLEPRQPAAEEPVRGTRAVAPELKPSIDPAPQPPAARSESERAQASGGQKTAGQRKNALVPAVQKIIKEQADLPAQAAILGVGDDGFPVLLDLYDPAPGALVIIGDEREEQLNVLRSAVISLAERATPRSMQIMILSCDPGQWRQWIAGQGYEKFCVGIEGVDDQDALREWILRLGDWTEQRRTGQRSGPPILLVLDTLSFLPRLPYDIRLNFEWMAKEGPAAQIWPLAAISSELAQMLSGRHLLRSFHTQILGFVDRPDFYVRHASLSPEVAEEFGEPGGFAVQVGEGWLRMRAPGR